MDVDKILDEYRYGDEGCRLRLFLAFRDLRDHFGRIEEESPKPDFGMKFLWSRNRRIARAA